MDEELKRCPFCGGAAILGYDDDNYPIVYCQSCGGRTDWYETTDRAVKAWNWRIK